MSEIIIMQKTQRLVVDPATRTVSIVTVGPIGPPGIQGPPGVQGIQGIPGPGFAYGLEAAKPATPAVPTRYYATDTKRDWQWDGTGWIIMDEPWAAWVPTIAGLTGGTTIAQKRRRGGRCCVRLRWAFTAGAAVSNPNFTLPHPADASQGTGVVLDMEVAGKTGQLYDSAGARRQALVYTTTDIFYIGFAAVSGTQVQMNPVGASAPFTWKTNDYMNVEFEYTMNSRYS